MNTLSITPADIAKVQAAGKLTFRPLTDQRFRCVQLPELGILSPTLVRNVRERIPIFVHLSSPERPRETRTDESASLEPVQIVYDWDYTCSGCTARQHVPTRRNHHRCSCGRLAEIKAHVVQQRSRTGEVVCPACDHLQYREVGRRKCNNCKATLEVEQYVDLVSTPLYPASLARATRGWW